MKPLPILLAVLVLSSGQACSGADPSTEISAEDLLARSGSGDAPLILDVRTPDEFSSGHVPGAINIPHDQVAARVAELGTPDTVVVYCESGRRAALAGDAIRAAGLEVVHLAGDMSAWRRAGHPTE